MLQVRFNEHEAAIKLSKITEISEIDPQLLADTIQNINNNITKVKHYDLNAVIDKFVSEHQNQFISLNEIEREIFKDFYHFRIFLNYTDVATMILSKIGISENSDQYKNLIDKSISLGFSLSTFDNNNAIEFLVSFYVINQIYIIQITQRKCYESMDKFYNCALTDIFDFCIY